MLAPVFPSRAASVPLTRTIADRRSQPQMAGGAPSYHARCTWQRARPSIRSAPDLSDTCKGRLARRRAYVGQPCLSSVAVVAPGHRGAEGSVPLQRRIPNHGQANPARPCPCRLPGRRSGGVQHPVQHVQPRWLDDDASEHRPLDGPEQPVGHDDRVGGAERLRTGAAPLAGHDAPGPRPGRLRPSIGARPLQCPSARLVAPPQGRARDRRGSAPAPTGGDPSAFAAIGDRVGSGGAPADRPSGNAALSETTTSTAPHLSVPPVLRADSSPTWPAALTDGCNEEPGGRSRSDSTPPR